MLEILLILYFGSVFLPQKVETECQAGGVKKILVVNDCEYNCSTFSFHDAMFQERLLHKKAIRGRLNYKEMGTIFSIK